MAITRQQAEARYGNASRLAKILHVKPQTVAGWPMDKPIPPTHQKTLAGWIDRDYWAPTYAQIYRAYPPYGGPDDARFKRTKNEFDDE